MAPRSTSHPRPTALRAPLRASLDTASCVSSLRSFKATTASTGSSSFKRTACCSVSETSSSRMSTAKVSRFLPRRPRPHTRDGALPSDTSATPWSSCPPRRARPQPLRTRTSAPHMSASRASMTELATSFSATTECGAIRVAVPALALITEGESGNIYSGSDSGSSGGSSSGSDLGPGNGSTVLCADGSISHSGGVQGACSHHGGVAP
jgi:hypothetical protein